MSSARGARLSFPAGLQALGVSLGFDGLAQFLQFSCRMMRCGHCGFQSNEPRRFTVTAVGNICDACYQRATLTRVDAELRGMREVEQFQARLSGWPVLSLLLCLAWLHLTTLGSFNAEAWVRLVVWGSARHDAIGDGEFYRLFTSMWLHIGYWHWLANSIAVCVIGALGERYLGRGRYLATFVVAGLGAALASAFIGQYGGGSVGASGGIMGLVGCLVAHSWRGGQSDSVRLFGRLALGLAAFLVAGDILHYLFTGIVGAGHAPISYAGHLGGLVSGALMGLALPQRQDEAPETSTEGAEVPGGASHSC